jgi:hypothetical protein
MLSNCHLSVYNYFCDKKYPGSSSIIDCLEPIKRSSGLAAASGYVELNYKPIASEIPITESCENFAGFCKSIGLFYFFKISLFTEGFNLQKKA